MLVLLPLPQLHSLGPGKLTLMACITSGPTYSRLSIWVRSGEARPEEEGGFLHRHHAPPSASSSAAVLGSFKAWVLPRGGGGGLFHCSDSSQPHTSLPFSPRARGGDSFPFVANPWLLHCPLNSAQNCARCLPETLVSQVLLSVFSLPCCVLTVPGTSLLPGLLDLKSAASPAPGFCSF